MEGKNLLIGEAVSYGWETMKRNFGFFAGLLLLIAIINLAAQYIPTLLSDIAPPLAIILGLGGWIITVEVALGAFKIFLRFADGQNPNMGELFSCFPLFINYLIASILYHLLIIVGLCLLIIPGLIWSAQFFFFPYFIVDKGAGPIEAFKLSSQATDGVKWQVLGLILLCSLINFVGMLALVVGLFATIPTTFVAFAHAYRQLVPRTDTPPVIMENAPL